MRCGFMNYAGRGGHGMMMPFGGIILAILIIVGIVLLINTLSRKNTNAVTPTKAEQTSADNVSDALKLLDERYIKGELEQEDYLRIKKDLRE